MTASPSIRPRRLALIGVAALIAAGIAAAALVLLPVSPQHATTAAAEAATEEPLALEYMDGTGAMRNLSQYRGKALLVNFWATWCAPCREEMPALDRLQEKLGSEQFEVIALSLDRGGPERVGRFLIGIGNRNLPLYIADMAAVRRAIGVFGLPTTLFLDREGREVHRLVGPAAWDSPAMISEITARLGLPAPPLETESEKP